MALHFATWSPELLAGTFFLVGAVAGGCANLWAIGLTTSSGHFQPDELKGPLTSPWYHLIPIFGVLLSRGRNRLRGRSVGISEPIVEIATGLLFAAYVLAAVRLQCQHVPEVQPDESWRTARIFFHLVLITLLVTATLTDLRKYAIPDLVTSRWNADRHFRPQRSPASCKSSTFGSIGIRRSPAFADPTSRNGWMPIAIGTVLPGVLPEPLPARV